MPRNRLTIVAALLLASTPALAHRLDEYLQGTILSVEKDRVNAQITLTPGVAVFRAVLGDIDTNGDGLISDAEQRAYASQVLHDLTISIDGQPLTPRLLSMQFPKIEEMKEGGGAIQIEFETSLPAGGASRQLIIENHHLNPISAYQVNCLVPRDPAIRITAQNRNYSQSFYQLDYTQPNSSFAHNPTMVGTVALLLFAGFGRVLKSRKARLPAQIGSGSL